MFEEGVAAPSREVPAGVASLRNRFETRAGSVPRTFPPRAFLPFVRHLTDDGAVCVDTQEEAFTSGTDADASKRASRLFAGEGRMDSDVCLPL